MDLSNTLLLSAAMFVFCAVERALSVGSSHLPRYRKHVLKSQLQRTRSTALSAVADVSDLQKLFIIFERDVHE